MNNFLTKLATTVVIGTSSILGAVEPAKATSCYTTTADDYICIHHVASNRYGTVKNVWYTLNGTSYQTKVTCNEVHRYNYTENLAGKACFEYSF